MTFALRFAPLLLLIFTVAILRADDAQAQAPVAGTVSAVSGTVQLQRGGATLPVTQGMPVQVGDRIITGDDGQVSVLLTDQSTLELADSSNVVIDQHAGATTRVNLAEGKLRSFVNRTIGAATPNFEVHTPNAVAAARGTLFTVIFTLPATSQLDVDDGVVNLANVINLPGGVDVPAGYESTVVGPNDPTPPKLKLVKGGFPWWIPATGALGAGGLAAGIYFAVQGGGSNGPTTPSR